MEAAAGQQQRFAELDALAARLLAAALGGRPVVTVTRGEGPQAADSVEVTALDPMETVWCAGRFGVREQQQRGAWYLPQKLSVKAGTLNLPHLLRARPAHALTVAADDSVRLQVADGADTLLVWALLVPLFDALLEPVRVRAAGPAGSHEEQRQLWAGIEERYRVLGVDDGALDVFRFGGGWHQLDRSGQQQVRLALLDTLAAADLAQLVARHRMLRLQELMAGFAKKAKTGTALARRVVTRALQPVVSGYFAGDWLAVLDYLQAPPHPDEEIITALPEPRLFVGMSSQATDMAAEAGIAEDEIHAMLAAFHGGSALSPVEERAAALHSWWDAFDQAHAVQSPGMPSLWGLVDHELMSVSRTDDGFTPQLYRQVLPTGVLEQVSRLWETVTLQRHPGSIVSNPRPHQSMADALGPAADFWHGLGLTAWFVCEGPYSRAPLSGVSNYYGRPLAALAAAGCPVETALFDELRTAEQRLGPEEMIPDGESSTVETPHGPVTFTSSRSRGMRREGFERVRDIITRYRRAWAKQYLDAYLQHRWRIELEDVARQHHRYVAAKGRPPTLIQFARFATEAANHWTGGDLGALYTAIGEPTPSQQQQRPTRLLAGDGYDFAWRVYQELGGKPVDHDTWMNTPEETRRQWQLGRLATESLRYLQLQEVLGQPPTAKQFGAHRLVWPWPGEEAEGWPVLQQVLATLAHTNPPSDTGPSPAADAVPPAKRQDGGQQVLAKGGNAPMATEAATIRITASGMPVDVSAVLLTSRGRVRGDDDLVFYNHPSQDGVRVNGNTVTADLSLIPESVSSVAVVVSVDPEARPGAVFGQDAMWEAEVTQPSGTRLSFTPPAFTRRETVAVAVELYRHTGAWKARAVGQGYDTGLAGLAIDYGIDVET
ncbi:TerD family protein [Streptomyces hirsutus]|uniref:TerD family protein n=1 Tax=Streptomyces hirsutus TaxID=35620 RepID=UPI0033C8C3EF